jgi:hypothetical protein
MINELCISIQQAHFTYQGRSNVFAGNYTIDPAGMPLNLRRLTQNEPVPPGASGRILRQSHVVVVLASDSNGDSVCVSVSQSVCKRSNANV